MKAIATIIAVILMVLLVITLASLAAMFIMGYFRARIAVVLTITEARCNSTHFMVDVRNEGTDTSSIVTVIVTNATGAEISGSIPSIAPLMIRTVTICRDP
ncbi:MAG: hypothetical protein QMD14_05070, partial [Candidatus Aenigmarchaeota archaeon]|nr:hypothetical protein [Candidatus Aenigmarchaeota archaeon]